MRHEDTSFETSLATQIVIIIKFKESISRFNHVNLVFMSLSATYTFNLELYGHNPGIFKHKIIIVIIVTINTLTESHWRPVDSQ